MVRALPDARLLSRYGTEWRSVHGLGASRHDLVAPVVEGLPYTGAEVLFAVREEMACTLDDVLSRAHTGEDPAGPSQHERRRRRRHPDRARLGLGPGGHLGAGGAVHHVVPRGARYSRPGRSVTESTPVTPIDALPADVEDRLGAVPVELPHGLLERLASSGAVVETDDAARAEAGRDWWPLAVGWAVEGAVPRRPAAVVRTRLDPTSVRRARRVPRGERPGDGRGRAKRRLRRRRSRLRRRRGLDMTTDHGVRHVDEDSLRADVRAGTFGPDLESALCAIGPGYTLGHWPQSMDLSTVGGWLACRGAGQYSTRYGKIEDMVVGLEVVLADGRTVRTEGRGPCAATGPNLTQLFVGSEGTLGVITEARLRIHPRPSAQERRAFGFATFAEGLHACRRMLRRGATPAVLRLYDRVESDRHFDLPDTNVLVVLDEADPAVLAATLAIVDAECDAAHGAQSLSSDLVARWLSHRNDVSALAPLWRAGFVVDTVEVAGPWSVLPGLFDEVIAALEDMDGTVAAVSAPVARLPRRRLPLLHLRRSQPRRWPRLARGLLPARGTP